MFEVVLKKLAGLEDALFETWSDFNMHATLAEGWAPSLSMSADLVGDHAVQDVRTVYLEISGHGTHAVAGPVVCVEAGPPTVEWEKKMCSSFAMNVATTFNSVEADGVGKSQIERGASIPVWIYCVA